ncbi:MAG: phosphohistidine phosphatase [Bacteroidia bacterium]|jgi:phosphohistidine phosphatase
MKTLTVVRHGKSDWTHEVPDHDRPLNKRGKSDLPVVANRLNQLKCMPDVCFFSTARRATDTANGLLDYMHVGAKREQSEHLYTFDGLDVIEFIKKIDRNANHVMIVGHNPGLTEVINRLSNVDLDNLPTLGFAQFRIDISYWSDVDTLEGELDFLEYPKMI